MYIISSLNGVEFAYNEHISWHICHLLVYQPLDNYWWINGRYKDENNMEFYTTPRLEAMMQDYTRLLESSENVGCTVRNKSLEIQLIIIILGM